MSENPYARLLVVPIAIGALFFGWLFVSWRCSMARNAAATRDGEGRLMPDLSTAEGKLKRAEQVEYESPSESVRLTIEVADGADTASASTARAVLPRRLLIQYQYASRSRWEEAEGALREIEKRAPASDEARQMRESWKKDSEYGAEAAARQGKFEDAGRLYETVFAAAGNSPDDRVIQNFQAYLLARSRRDEAAGKKADAARWLDEAAAWVEQPLSVSPFTKELSKQGGAASREKAHAAAAAGHPAQALTWLGAARFAFDAERKPEEQHACEAEVPALALQAARGVRDGKIRTIPARSIENFWREGAESKDAAVRVAALDGLAVTFVEEALAESRAGEFIQADSHFHDALERVIPDWWMARAEAEVSFDVWAGVPKEVLAEVEKQSGPKPTPEVRRQVLGGLLRDGRWTPPHPSAAIARAALPDFYARWGASLMAERKFSQAEWMVRGAIRADPKGEPAKACIAALEKGIREAAGNHDLEGLVQLTSFYVSELGAPAPAFAGEFRNAVTSAAEGLKSSPIRRIFMLSLLCDVFPGTAEASAARDEILDKGLAFAKAAAEQPGEPGLTMDTGLKDLAAVSIENATGYHIFVFYEGPERFFVRLNPYRKGTIVLRPGAYVVGVVAPEEKIRPYHASRNLEALTHWDRYTIVQEGGERRDLLGSSSAAGGYLLLRGLPALKVEVDVETGAVRMEK